LGRKGAPRCVGPFCIATEKGGKAVSTDGSHEIEGWKDRSWRGELGV
jgi:hypothetical protein